MVPWLAEVSRIKIIVFTFTCVSMCVLATTCRIDERKSQAFLFESISRLSAARFMISRETSFWVVDGMIFWPWKIWIEWPKTVMID